MGYESIALARPLEFCGANWPGEVDCQPKHCQPSIAGERGAIILVVAACLLALTLLSAIVFDYGVLWVARGQAQNAADAGALAAAQHTLLFPSDVTGARAAAQLLANRNPIWGEAPAAADVLVELPITCPPGTGGGVSCARVDVMRGGRDRFGAVHTNTLPVFFAAMAGMTAQRIQATATSQLAGANHADCLRPWFILDKPDPGYTADDIGEELLLDSRVTSSGFGKIDVGTGEDAVKGAVYQCAGDGLTIGETVATQTGGAGQPTVNAVNDVIGWDFNARYDPISESIEGSCVPTCNCSPYSACPNGNRMSPRVFVAPVCSPTGDPGCVSGGNGRTHQITITKFLSFFIVSARAHGNDIEIHAILIGGAGSLESGPADPGGFLRTVRLVR